MIKPCECKECLSEDITSYSKRVKSLTEKILRKTNLPNQDKRSGGYEVDHIVSIWAGFRFGIPAEKLASVENLRFITRKENVNKSKNLTAKAMSILAEWGFTNLRL